jgi:hypothetical protein
MSDFKERCNAGLFAFIGFPHAEYVAIRATRRIANNDHPSCQQAIADDSLFAVLFTGVFELKGNSLEDYLGIREVQPSVPQSSFSLNGVEGNVHAGYCSYNNKKLQWRFCRGLHT